ncbi:hypothetical protein HDV06_005418 [Boothiomyces sp. JEL0866]|nr:hypothetical protein HDV06_005418 [Boothiomyces sp. JEL0866]
MTSEIEVKEFNGFVYKRKKIPKVESVEDEPSINESIQEESIQEKSIQEESAVEPSVESIQAKVSFQAESEFLDTVVLDDSIDMSSILEQDILPDIESILMKPKRKRSSIYSKPSIPESVDPSNYHKLINPDLPELVKLKQLFTWLIKAKSKSFPNPVNFNPNSTDPIIKAVQQDLLGFEFDFKNEPKGLKPNPKNEELRDRIMLFKNQIERYDQEINDWNNLLDHYTNLNAEQKQQSQQVFHEQDLKLFINTDLDLYKPAIDDSFKKQYYNDLHDLHMLKTKSKTVMKQLDDIKRQLLKSDEKVDAKDVLRLLSV